jgi:NAD(P)-dependent dehydrogenase (short-subunit alcohol dehydrogenase family)
VPYRWNGGPLDSLAGKVAVVTGAARGIGLGLAQAFAEEGARVVLSDIDGPALESAVASLREAGTDAIGVTADVTDIDAVTRLRDVTFEVFGTAHIVCNNPGPAASARLDEPIDVEQWKRVMDLLVYSVLHGINIFLPRLLEQGEGHFVNTASRSALVPVPILGAYSPAKSAVLSLSEVLHANLTERESPVGVTVLTPGFIRTERSVAALAAKEPSEQADPAFQAFFVDRMARAVDPIDLGRLTVRAIKENVLYVNTHRETFGWLEERVDRMVADADRIGTVR